MPNGTQYCIFGRIIPCPVHNLSHNNDLHRKPTGSCYTSTCQTCGLAAKEDWSRIISSFDTLLSKRDLDVHWPGRAQQGSAHHVRNRVMHLDYTLQLDIQELGTSMSRKETQLSKTCRSGMLTLPRLPTTVEMACTSGQQMEPVWYSCSSSVSASVAPLVAWLTICSDSS